jgi:hypothetical protein
MLTTFEYPDLQNAGEDCQSCKKFWEHQGLPPMKLVNIYTYDAHDDIMTTGTRGKLATYDDGGEIMILDDPEPPEDKCIPIVICPRCDGDVILRLPKE